METYSTIVEYKTSYYSFVLPFRLAMIMAGTYEKSDIYKQFERILLEMGQLFQIKDDFLDCFGDPKVTGKIGTDIQERKCTWLLVESIRLMVSTDDKHQGQLLEEKYLAGKYDPSAVEEVKRMYEGLGMRKYYSEHVANKLSWIRTEIGKLSESSGFPPGLTTMLGTVLKQTFS
jgi:farnesyl diphosphate synthase